MLVTLLYFMLLLLLLLLLSALYVNISLNLDKIIFKEFAVNELAIVVLDFVSFAKIIITQHFKAYTQASIMTPVPETT